MTVIEELRILRRHFPRAEELAVSEEMLERYEGELVRELRFYDTEPILLRWPPPEDLLGRVLQRTPFRFRGATLVTLT